MKEWKSYLGGEWVATGDTREAVRTFDKKPIGTLHLCGPAEMDVAITRAAVAFLGPSARAIEVITGSWGQFIYMRVPTTLTRLEAHGLARLVEDLLDEEATLDRAILVLLGSPASQETRDTLEKQLDDPQILQASLDDKIKQVNTAMIAGLVLGSPEFQRR